MHLERDFLGCDAMQPCTWLPTFRRNASFPCYTPKRKATGSPEMWAVTWLPAWHHSLVYVHLQISFTRAACPSHLTLLDLLSLIIFCEEKQLSIIRLSPLSCMSKYSPLDLDLKQPPSTFLPLEQPLTHPHRHQYTKTALRCKHDVAHYHSLSRDASQDGARS
jgi:hypothetical protein